MNFAELRVLARSRQIDVTEDRYVLQDREGDFVLKVEGTGWETVKIFFVFTDDREQALVFTYNELWNKATLGFNFVASFAGARAIRLKRKS